jgi:hypothetical protein
MSSYFLCAGYRLVKPRKSDDSKKEKLSETADFDQQPSAAQYDVIREVSKTSKFYVPQDFANGYRFHFKIICYVTVSLCRFVRFVV